MQWLLVAATTMGGFGFGLLVGRIWALLAPIAVTSIFFLLWRGSEIDGVDVGVLTAFGIGVYSLIGVVAGLVVRALAARSSKAS